ncbi:MULTISPECIES: serine acetyltransferase [Mycobacterium]|uniref:Serine acetyltransferase n=1 Tax=Mycobacterium kiyosense TaxID=2871094 RepID=A0A9P3UYQ4_9MYCO|nr:MULTISPECIES: serine acetyltransferase [Mycobacterium]BDB44708.1 serine acetyltransferase [Mycobacterium kiyosense]BDE16204.1 serine acetyltransferase [Mycobacterium sp. 20KCMC460]GLB82125.1 serine acetyltransferase [Mycobacterium kiyosense]GLB90584.1 serine acetyltransferase [Mycobacterium kiyosense]GLB95267.1 serine acetyltransferase [Mycobacterium kiyosense]
MIQTRTDLESYLAADLRAQGLERWRHRYRIIHRAPYFQRMLRKTEYWTNTARTPGGRLVAAYLRLRLKFLGERLGFGIPLNAFGPGLSVAHVGWVHVHHRARIGANCRIHQGVTLGEGRPGEYPRIGDDVFISPGAMVLGATVGSRVGIYAGAVVNQAVPDDVDVAGVPARIVRDRRPVSSTRR